jgi:predicted RNA-binding protein with PUA-like domain
MARRYWLVKTDPDTYAIEDLEREGTTEWWGVRNYLARNYMRDDMSPGDPVLLYHSSTPVLGVYGLARVAGPAHPDSKQFEEGHPYEDPASDPADPTWWCVDLEHVETFDSPVTRDAMKTERALSGMKVLQRGVRHSILPVTPGEFEAVIRMARGAD